MAVAAQFFKVEIAVADWCYADDFGEGIYKIIGIVVTDHSGNLSGG